MKKWLFFVACLGLVAALSGEGLAGQNVENLEPVQTVYLAADGSKIILQTDTGSKGSGNNFEAALMNLQETTPALVFLDTAEYLLVDSRQQHLIAAFQDLLRPSCSVCMVEGQPDMEKVGLYLKVHEPKLTMKDYIAGERDLPTLIVSQEGMQLVS